MADDRKSQHKRHSESRNALTRQINVIHNSKNKRNKSRHSHKGSKVSASDDSMQKCINAKKPISQQRLIQSVKQPPLQQPAVFEIDPKTQAVFDRKNYRVIEKLSQGSFGLVFKGEYVVDHRLVAIKVMDYNKLSEMFRRKYVSRELKALTECRHKNVVQIFDIIRSNNRLFIFMEFCSNGNLADYIKKNGACQEQLAKFWFRQIAEALLHVHMELKMAHRDIKLDNVLLDEHFNAKLTDFGFAKDIWNEQKQQVELSATICGTEPYMCPQLIQRIQYNAYQADVWALGVLLYGLLNGRFPFSWNDTALMISEQMNYPKFIQSIVLAKISDEAMNLMVKMLDPDEQTRISLAAVTEHPWLLRVKTNTNGQSIMKSIRKTIN